MNEDNLLNNPHRLPQLINVDWLQFWCLWKEFDPEKWSRRSNFKVKREYKGTRVFAEVWKVSEKSAYTSSHRDEPFAVMAVKPYSPLIDAKMVLIKIENRPLYHANLYKRVVLMLKAFDFEYKAITRLDICADQVRFACGISPLDLLEGYFTNIFPKSGSRMYAKWATAPFTSSTIPYKITEETLAQRHVCHSVSWGGATSDVHVKIYNKTREIKVESGKEYIRRWWRLNGLDTDEDVWRVEFSIGGRSRSLIDVNTSELVQVSLLEACSHKYMVATFNALADRHFSFIDTRLARTRKYAPTLRLFDFPSTIEYKTITMPSHPTPTRTAKVCINYLAKLTEETNLARFCRSDLEAAKAIYNCMIVLSNIYDDMKMMKGEYEWRVRDYAQQMLADLQLLNMMGVVRYEDSVERLEDVVQMLESNDKRRKLEESLYYAYLLSKENQKEIASGEVRSGSARGIDGK